MKTSTILLIIGWIFTIIEIFFVFRKYDVGLVTGLAIGFLVSSLILQYREDKKRKWKIK